MRSLRIAFLSALVLELIATLSVALVAVQIGVRLLYGAARPGDRAARADPRAGGVPARCARSGRGSTPAWRGSRRPSRSSPCWTGPAACPRTGRIPLAVPEGPIELRFDDVRLTHPERTVAALDGVDLVVPAGRTLLLTGTERRRQDDAALGAAPVRRRRRGADHGDRDGPARPARSSSGAVGSRGCRSGRTCSTPAWPTTSASACRTPTTRRSRGRSRSRRPRTSSPPCPTGTPPCSASAARGCRPGQRQRDRPGPGVPAPDGRRLAGAARRAHRAPGPGQRGGRPRGRRPAAGGGDGDRGGPRRRLGGPRGRGGPPGGGARRCTAGALGSGPMSAAAAVQEPDERPVRPDRFRRAARSSGKEPAGSAAADARARAAPRGPVRPWRARRRDRHGVGRRPAVRVGVADRHGRDAAAAHPAQRRDRRHPRARHPARGRPLPGAARHPRRGAAHAVRRPRPRLRPPRPHRTGAARSGRATSSPGSSATPTRPRTSWCAVSPRPRRRW